MEVITIILVFLAAVVVSSVITRALPIAVPLPLVQITLGALIAATLDFRIALEPEVFFPLFIAPLLFLDGWRIPKEGLFRDRWLIFALAFGLVVFTVIGAGYFIHWMIPAMPLAIAFALAAVLSPTDAVGVSAIAERVPIPKRLMHILEGESLLNDASGLVCMRFAVAAATTGTLSIGNTIGTFLWLAVGGISMGVVVTSLANLGKDWIARKFGEETGSQILISLLIPFGAYMSADYVHASGILAVVAAGIVMSYEERSGRALAVTRIRRAAVWDAIQFAGNGAIFVLLGQQLPGIVANAGLIVRETGRQDTLWLLFYIAAIACVLVVLRALWSWATLGLILFRRSPRKRHLQTSEWRLIAVTSLAGVRGALTLAGVMTLPLALQDGSAFPTRDLAILLAAGTIVTSLVAANITLPYLLKGLRLPPEPLSQQREDEARLAAARAAIDAIDHRLLETQRDKDDGDLYMQAGERIIGQYRERIESRSNRKNDATLSRKLDEIERKLRLLAINAERREFYRFSRSGLLSEESTRRLVREADLMESRFRST